MRLSVILPVYNECKRMRKNFPGIYREVKRLGSFEIIIAEDGSTDCTKEISKRFARLPGVRLISKERRLGKGAALKNAIGRARGDVICFMDVDLSVPLRYVPIAVRMVEQGHRFVIGSRYMRGSRIRRRAGRLITSVGYNAILRILFNSKVRDHQCGFKFWDAGFVKREIKEIRDDHWFFDSEMILRAEREGVYPYEMPVEWNESKGTKVRAPDILYFIKSALWLRMTMH